MPHQRKTGEFHCHRATPASSPAGVALGNPGVIKKSQSGICHAPGTMYYAQTLRFTPYQTVENADTRSIAVMLSPAMTLRRLGLRTKVLPRLPVEHGIDLGRQLLRKCYFDKTRCRALLRALGAYRYEWDEARGSLETKPRHDSASHFADSFRYLACGYRETRDAGAEAACAGDHGVRSVHLGLSAPGARGVAVGPVDRVVWAVSGLPTLAVRLLPVARGENTQRAAKDPWPPVASAAEPRPVT
jgi:hypothetical protein